MENTLHTHSLATAGLRITSGIIDSAILVGICVVIRVVFRNALADYAIAIDLLALSTDLFTLLFSFIYLLFLLPLMESYGGSIGNRITGIIMIDMDTNEPVHFKKAFYRSVARFLLLSLGVFPILISTLAITSSHLRQAWYDRWNNTLMMIKD